MSDPDIPCTPSARGMISSTALARLLRRATWLFLALPVGIFFAGWLRWPLALALCGLLAAALWRDEPPGGAATPASADGEGNPRLSRLALWLALVVPAVVFTALCGVGGWGSGDSDWLKHDTILRDLLARPWPVTYASGQGRVLLVYYVAFYLPAALLGKLAGGSWVVASQALAATTLLGVVLSGGWMVALATLGVPTRRTRWSAAGLVVLAAAVFFGFSGLEVVGKIAVNTFLRLPPFYGDWNDIEWWAQFAQYSSNAAALFWAPQHALGGWLTAALALDDWFRRGGVGPRAILYVALALAWSPFAALGLLPLLAGMILWPRVGQRLAAAPSAEAVQSSGMRHALTLAVLRSREMVTLPNAAGLAAGGLLALFFAAHFQDFPLPARYRVTPGFHPMPLLQVVPRGALYVAFVCLQFLGFSLALSLFFRPAKSPPAAAPQGTRSTVPAVLPAVGSARCLPLLWLSTAVLLVLPCFRYGYANDLVMRGGIPALFVLQVLLVRMFARTGHHATPRQRVAVLLAGVLLFGGLGNTFLEYRRHVVRMLAQGSWRDARTREPVRTLAELHRTIYARPGFDFTRQYLGSAESPFARYLAAPRGGLRPDAAVNVRSDF